MKQIFKYIGIFSLVLFSFFYANNIAIFMRSKTDLMKKIRDNEKSQKIAYVNAVINDDYIIPGINGLAINIEDSYNNMLKVGTFDDNYLIYDEIAPSISLQDNLKKIIKKANPLKESIALIISDKELLEYSLKNNITINYLIDKDSLINVDNVELINNESNYFYEVERFLNKSNRNKNICIINDYNKKICESNGKYLVLPTYTINESNLAHYISEIDNGDIIRIDNMSLTSFIILINKIKYRNLRFDHLSDLISEKYSSL